MKSGVHLASKLMLLSRHVSSHREMHGDFFLATVIIWRKWSCTPSKSTILRR